LGALRSVLLHVRKADSDAIVHATAAALAELVAWCAGWAALPGPGTAAGQAPWAWEAADRGGVLAQLTDLLEDVAAAPVTHPILTTLLRAANRLVVAGAGQGPDPANDAAPNKDVRARLLAVVLPRSTAALADVAAGTDVPAEEASPVRTRLLLELVSALCASGPPSAAMATWTLAVVHAVGRCCAAVLLRGAAIGVGGGGDADEAAEEAYRLVAALGRALARTPDLLRTGTVPRAPIVHLISGDGADPAGLDAADLDRSSPTVTIAELLTSPAVSALLGPPTEPPPPAVAAAAPLRRALVGLAVEAVRLLTLVLATGAQGVDDSAAVAALGLLQRLDEPVRTSKRAAAGAPPAAPVRLLEGWLRRPDASFLVVGPQTTTDEAGGAAAGEGARRAGSGGDVGALAVALLQLAEAALRQWLGHGGPVMLVRASGGVTGGAARAPLASWLQVHLQRVSGWLPELSALARQELAATAAQPPARPAVRPLGPAARDRWMAALLCTLRTAALLAPEGAGARAAPAWLPSFPLSRDPNKAVDHCTAALDAVAVWLTTRSEPGRADACTVTDAAEAYEKLAWLLVAVARTAAAAPVPERDRVAGQNRAIEALVRVL
jgi:hypothetical protein